jgi:hypothetical protein
MIYAILERMSDKVDNAIPLSAAPFFQEYRFEELDADLDRGLVIERILAFGDRQELRWLFQRYNMEEIRQWIMRQGASRLLHKRYNFFCVVLDLPVSQPQEQQIWNH